MGKIYKHKVLLGIFFLNCNMLQVKMHNTLTGRSNGTHIKLIKQLTTSHKLKYS